MVLAEQPAKDWLPATVGRLLAGFAVNF